ncbi:MAG: hypothetical protein AAGG48_31580 [Planctomycetota bacterium]
MSLHLYSTGANILDNYRDGSVANCCVFGPKSQASDAEYEYRDAEYE